MSVIRGLVTDTIRFSSVDGPGNRFVVFLQGCNFDCVACHNPYTINVCNDCGECIATCPSGALSMMPDGKMRWDQSVCTDGDTCLAVCPYDASPKAVSLEVDDLIRRIVPVAPFLSGVTVSGGEATQQAAFVGSLFQAIKASPTLRRLTCFVDSNGAAEPPTWIDLAPVMDGAMIDLKCFDDAIHRSMTGRSNLEVLASIRQLAGMGRLYEVRLLLMAGVNDDVMLMRRTARWLAEVDPTMRVKVIGFRRHGVRPHEPQLVEPRREALDRAASVLAETASFELCVV